MNKFYTELSEFKSLTLEEQNQKLFQSLFLINEVMEIGEGEVGGDSLLRTSFGDRAGSPLLGLGSFSMGWRTAEFATGYGFYMGAMTCHSGHSEGDLLIGDFIADDPAYIGNQNTIVGPGAAGKIQDGYNNSLFGNGITQYATEIKRVVGMGLGAGSGLTTLSILNSVLLGEDAAGSAIGNIKDHVSLGWEATKGGNPVGGVHLGNQAGFGESEPYRLHISNNKTESLIYGKFDKREVKINGSIEMEAVVIGGIKYTMTVAGDAIKLSPL